MKKLWTLNEDKILKDVYPSGDKTKLMELLPDRSWIAIKARATKIKGLTFKRRGLPVDESFFSSWSPSMAYVLGYIFADGCITRIKRKHTYAWYWQIGSIDKQIIEDISKLVKWGGKILKLNRTKEQGYYADYIFYRLTIGSNKMVSDLKELGVTRKKSLTLQPPNKIPKNMIHHFLRGYWDGDGSVHKLSGDTSYLSASVGSGSYDMIDWIANIIGETLNIPPRNIVSSNRSEFYSINLVGHNAHVFLKWLYKDATIFLKRKHNVFQVYDKHGRHPDNEPKKIVTIRSNWSSHS